MSNVAYTKEYQEHRQTYEYVFNKKYLTKVKTVKITDSITARVTHYFDDSRTVSPYEVRCSLTRITNKRNGTVYVVKSIDYQSELFYLVEHQNRNQYLIYKIDLYGYSILDLSTMNGYDFVPEESFKGGENFILTGLHYNNKSNLLAAEGCFWACPSDTVLYDLSNPLDIPYPECDLAHQLGYDNYEIYDDIDFAGWDHDDNLILKCSDGNSDINKYNEIIIDKSTCFKYLDENRR